ncbi:MAG: PQQ-binding-like beta-propeller repeat protein [Actinoplanes sp.]
MSVIELGELASSPGPEPDDAPTPGFDRRLVRQVAIAALTAFTLLAVTGSVVPEPRGVRPLWSVPVREQDGVTLGAESAFLTRTDDDVTRITGYDLATGRVLWERDVRGSVGWVQQVRDGEMLLLPGNRQVAQFDQGSEEVIATEFHRETTALDARTGAELWRTAGEPHTADTDSILLAEHTDQGRINRLRLVRATDGGTIWAKAITNVENQVVGLLDNRPHRLVTASPTGEITVFRYADGALISRAKVPWVTARPEEGYFNDLAVAGDYLVMNQSRRERVDQVVYRLDTMTEQWRANKTDGYGFFCGDDLLCLNQGSGIVAREIANGRPRWEIESSGNLFPLTDDRLLADTGMDDGNPSLVDAATGRLVGAPVEGSTVWNIEVDDAVLLLRPTMTPVGRTMILRWDLADGRQRLLGSIESQTAQRCQAVPKYLACYRESGLYITGVG